MESSSFSPTAADADAVARLFPRECLLQFLEAGCRSDGRDFVTPRRTVIARNTLASADGSALVKVGHTSVMCGIRLEVGMPHHHKPHDGALHVSVTLPALCSPRFDPRTASTALIQSDARALASTLQSTVLGAGLLDLSQLGILEATAAWVLYADVVCLDHDGNLFDAALLALTHALATVRLPATVIPDDKTVFVTDAPPRPLVLHGALFPLSFAEVAGHLLVDPSAEEETHQETGLSLVIDDAGAVCGLFKPGGEALPVDTLDRAMQLAAARAGAAKTSWDPAAAGETTGADSAATAGATGTKNKGKKTQQKPGKQMTVGAEDGASAFDRTTPHLILPAVPIALPSP